jgi:phosphoserine phosphatase RsbU/P
MAAMVLANMGFRIESLLRTLSLAAGVRRHSYWRDVPLKRLKFLFLAVFCLVGMVACLLDIMVLGRKPFAEVLGWTVFTGVMAVVYLVFALRAPRLLLLAPALHLLLSRAVRLLIRHLTAGSAGPQVEFGVRFAAVACLLLSMFACLFFLFFIYREGRHSIRLQTELALAHGIQKTLVPPLQVKSPSWEVYGVSLPSEKVGGDLVDVVPDGEWSAVAYVADISGHGLPAGILMGMFKTAARTCIAERPALSALLKRINQILPAVKEPEMYATSAFLRFSGEPSGGCEVEFALAGHPPILHFSATRGAVQRLGDASLPVGLLPAAEYCSQKFEANSNDLLLIATDGVMEVMDGNGTEFGIERLEFLLAENRGKDLRAIASTIFEAAAAWGKQNDDQTLLLTRFS